MKKIIATFCLAAVSAGVFALVQNVRETGTFSACGTTYSYVVYIPWHSDTDAFYNDWQDHVDALQAAASSNCGASTVVL